MKIHRKAETQHRTEGTFIGSEEYGYDIRNNLTNLITSYGGKSHNQSYYYSDVAQSKNSGEYEKDNLPTMYKLYNSRYAIYDYDSLNRLVQRDFSTDAHLFYNYTYKKSDKRNATGETKYTTTQIQDEYIGDDVYIYGYDVLGNITSIKTATRTATGTGTLGYGTISDYVTYTYDDLGQLTRENLAGEKTTVWSYDDLGNITAKNEYAYTTGTVGTATQTVTYGYGKDNKSGWNNLLVSVDENGNGTTDAGESITYDAIGNPTTYLGASLTWNGRQLTGYTDANQTITYTYDSDGLRATKTQKDYTTTNGTKTLAKTTETKYYYVNGQLHFQDTLATKADGSTVVTKLYFFYDSNGYLSAIEYNGTTYFVATNQRGDVVALYYANGKIMGRYEYDAWGNVINVQDIYYDSAGNQVTADLTNNTTSRDLLVVNPIRYRGYYYDVETKLYYLQSRYYNPEVGRFLNADSKLSDMNGPILGYNMFAYCQNNPVNLVDPSGHWSKLAERISFVASCVAVVASAVACVAAAVTAPYLLPTTTALLTVSVGGLSNGIANAADGNSFANGNLGGTVSSSIEVTSEKYFKGMKSYSVGVGAEGVGTMITMAFDNLDNTSQKSSVSQIGTAALKSMAISSVTNIMSGTINSGVDMANETGTLMSGYTKGFGYGLKTFFSVLDDAITFVWGDDNEQE